MKKRILALLLCLAMVLTMTPVSVLAETPSSGGDEAVRITSSTGVATYTSLAEAFGAAQSGDTISIQKDLSEQDTDLRGSEGAPFAGDLTIDLNGHNVTMNTVDILGDLTIQSTGSKGAFYGTISNDGVEETTYALTVNNADVICSSESGTAVQWEGNLSLQNNGRLSISGSVVLGELEDSGSFFLRIEDTSQLVFSDAQVTGDLGGLPDEFREYLPESITAEAEGSMIKFTDETGATVNPVTLQVQEESPVVSVNGTEYSNLMEALSVVSEYSYENQTALTITFLDDCDDGLNGDACLRGKAGDDLIPDDPNDGYYHGNVEFRLNGHSVSLGNLSIAADVTVTGPGSFNCGTLENPGGEHTLTVSNAQAVCEDLRWSAKNITVKQSGKLTASVNEVTLGNATDGFALTVSDTARFKLTAGSMIAMTQNENHNNAVLEAFNVNHTIRPKGVTASVPESGTSNYLLFRDGDGNTYDEEIELFNSECPAAASIGEQSYLSLDAALKAASEGDTIKICRDINEPDAVLCDSESSSFSGYLTIDLQSYSVTMGRIDIMNSLTVTGTGQLTCQLDNANVNGPDVLSVNGATLNCADGSQWMAKNVVVENGGTLCFAGSISLGGGDEDGFNLSITDGNEGNAKSKVEINDCSKFGGINTARIADQISPYLPGGWDVESGESSISIINASGEAAQSVTLKNYPTYKLTVKNDAITHERGIKEGVVVSLSPYNPNGDNDPHPLTGWLSTPSDINPVLESSGDHNGYEFTMPASDVELEPVFGHVKSDKENEHFAAVEPTCTETGSPEYWKCLYCDAYVNNDGEAFSENDLVIPAKGHDLESHPAKAATCTEDGNNAYWKCTVCSKYFSDAEGTTEISENSWVVPATGHTLDPHSAKAATCTENGNSAYWYCDKCGKYFSDADGTTEITQQQTVEPATGHTWTPTWTWTEDHSTATAEFTCSSDSSHTKTLVASNTDITSQDDPASTCSAAGSRKYTAMVTLDGETYTNTDAETLPLASHTLAKTDAKAATCTEDGNNAYWKCTVCGKYFSDAEGTTEISENSWVVPATGHTLDPHSAKAATCTENGNSAYWYCDKCGKYFSDAEGKNVIEANSWVLPADSNAHSWGQPTYTWAEDYSAVTAKRVCSINSNHTEEETASATSEVTTTPTCTETGIRTYTGASFENSAFEVQIKEVTEPAAGHDLEHHTAAEPACTDVGNIEYWQCKTCKKYFSDAEGTQEITENDTIRPSLEHNMTEHPAKDASCTETGNTAYWSCDRCSKFFSDSAGEMEISEEEFTIDALGHQMEEVAAQSHTCTQDGVIAHYHCTRCNNRFSDSEGEEPLEEGAWIDPARHDLTHVEAVAPTCTESGTKEHWHCKTCNKDFSDEAGTTVLESVVDPAGHSMTHHAAVPATCTQDGTVEYWSCSKCNKNYKEEAGTTVLESVVDPAGHSMTHHAAVPATCTQDGTVEYWSCSKCNKNYGDEAGTTVLESVVDPAGHSMTHHAAVAATCTQDGTVEYWSCSKCNKNYKDEAGATVLESIVDPAGHSMTHHAAVAATCTQDGTVEYWSCSKCNKNYKEEAGTTVLESVVDPAGHSMTHHAAVAATCTQDGTVEYWSCSKCNKNYGEEAGTTVLESIVDPAGHKLTETKAKDATCEAAGNSAYWTCSACGKYFSDANGENEIEKDSWVIAAKSHSWGQPTYTWSEDYKTVTAKRVCANDSSHVETETVETTDQVTKTAGCTEKGVRTYSSGTFRNTAFEPQQKTVDIDPAGHKLTETKAKDATCEAAGNSAYWTCSTCGKYFSDAEGKNEIEKDSWVIAAKSHSWGQPTWTWAEDHSTASAKFTCSSDSSHTKTLVASNTDITSQDDPASTCSAEGSRKYTATVTLDGKTYTNTDAATLPLASHTLAKTDAKAATCTENGNSAYWYCDKCGKYFSDAEGKNEIEKDSWVIAAKSHSWGQPTYTWSEDYKTVTAKRVCANDSSHVETETVGTTDQVTKTAGCTEKGVRTYSSGTFRNTAFEPQQKTVDIDPTGHSASEQWEHDESAHWKKCTVCGQVAGESQAHTWDSGNAGSDGMTVYTCTVCGFQKTEMTPAQLIQKGLQQLRMGLRYCFGSGSHTVSGDPTVYNGNQDFYVTADGSYTIG